MPPILPENLVPGKLYIAINRKREGHYINKLSFDKLIDSGTAMFYDYKNNNMENMDNIDNIDNPIFTFSVNVWIFYQEGDPDIPTLVQDKIKKEEAYTLILEEEKRKKEEADKAAKLRREMKEREEEKADQQRWARGAAARAAAAAEQEAIKARQSAYEARKKEFDKEVLALMQSSGITREVAINMLHNQRWKTPNSVEYENRGRAGGRRKTKRRKTKRRKSKARRKNL
jgi:hypothetical protein